jgi:hypothetical protein
VTSPPLHRGQGLTAQPDPPPTCTGALSRRRPGCQVCTHTVVEGTSECTARNTETQANRGGARARWEQVNTVAAKRKSPLANGQSRARVCEGHWRMSIHCVHSSAQMAHLWDSPQATCVTATPTRAFTTRGTLGVWDMRSPWPRAGQKEDPQLRVEPPAVTAKSLSPHTATSARAPVPPDIGGPSTGTLPFSPVVDGHTRQRQRQRQGRGHARATCRDEGCWQWASLLPYTAPTPTPCPSEPKRGDLRWKF